MSAAQQSTLPDARTCGGARTRVPAAVAAPSDKCRRSESRPPGRGGRSSSMAPPRPRKIRSHCRHHLQISSSSGQTNSATAHPSHFQIVAFHLPLSRPVSRASEGECGAILLHQRQEPGPLFLSLQRLWPRPGAVPETLRLGRRGREAARRRVRGRFSRAAAARRRASSFRARGRRDAARAHRVGGRDAGGPRGRGAREPSRRLRGAALGRRCHWREWRQQQHHTASRSSRSSAGRVAAAASTAGSEAEARRLVCAGASAGACTASTASTPAATPATGRRRPHPSKPPPPLSPMRFGAVVPPQPPPPAYIPPPLPPPAHHAAPPPPQQLLQPPPPLAAATAFDAMYGSDDEHDEERDAEEEEALLQAAEEAALRDAEEEAALLQAEEEAALSQAAAAAASANPAPIHASLDSNATIIDPPIASNGTEFGASSYYNHTGPIPPPPPSLPPSSSHHHPARVSFAPPPPPPPPPPPRESSTQFCGTPLIRMSVGPSGAAGMEDDDYAENAVERALGSDGCGLPKSVIDAYKGLGVHALYPWQHECLLKHGVLDGLRHLVYCTPTSGGKSLVADVLVGRSLASGRKALPRFTLQCARRGGGRSLTDALWRHAHDRKAAEAAGPRE